MSKYVNLENIGYLAMSNNEKFLFNDKNILNEIEQAKKFLKCIGRKTEYLYINMFPAFGNRIELVYFDKIFLYRLFSSEDYSEDYDKCKKLFLHFENIYHRAYENGKYENISMYLDMKFLPTIFNVFYPKMSNEDKFKNFINMYKYCDYALKNKQ